LLLLCCLIYASAESECPAISMSGDRRDNLNVLRIMQYNTEWLYIDYYKSMDCPGDGCPWHTIEDAQTHMDYVTNVINDLQPDIVNICEVEGCDELNMLVEQLGENYVPYLKNGTDTSTGQNVGIVTKVDPTVDLYRSEERIAYPLEDSQCGSSANGTTGVSKHYITEFVLGDINIAIIGAHLLAIPTDPDRCSKREAQSQVLQNIVSSYIDKKYEIILLGDFNDYDNEIMDVNFNKPLSMVLDILKGNAGSKKGTYSLTNIAYKMQQEDRFSDWWDSDNNCETSSSKDYSMIDHILVTSNIDEKIVNAFIHHDYDEYCGKMNSDHYPVIIDIEI